MITFVHFGKLRRELRRNRALIIEGSIIRHDSSTATFLFNVLIQCDYLKKVGYAILLCYSVFSIAHSRVRQVNARVSMIHFNSDESSLIEKNRRDYGSVFNLRVTPIALEICSLSLPSLSF